MKSFTKFQNIVDNVVYDFDVNVPHMWYRQGNVRILGSVLILVAK